MNEYAPMNSPQQPSQQQPPPGWNPQPPAYPYPPKRPNWFARHKWLTGLGVGFVAIVALASTGTSEDTADNPAGTSEVRTHVGDGAGAGLEAGKTKADPKPKPKPEPVETVSQANARETAQDYLDYSGFSRSGLIGQVKFDGYSTADATYGVNALHADWNEQAVRVAKDYLDYSSFSRSGLIGQLKFDGFTQAQAEYGATQVGL